MISSGDTLICDSLRLARWQTDPSYNYNRELQTPEVDLFEWMYMQFHRLLDKIFGSKFAEDYSEVILIALFVVLALLILWFLYKKRPALFMRTGGKALAYTVQEDTIYGVDFQAEINVALGKQNYKEAVRLLYLQTLKSLSDKEIIDWQFYKTPTQYTYEVKSDQLREPFRNLTNRFLRVRYGNFEASEALFNQMKLLQEKIEEGGGR